MQFMISSGVDRIFSDKVHFGDKTAMDMERSITDVVWFKPNKENRNYHMELKEGLEALKSLPQHRGWASG
eukprot:3432501-Heterocapsa_arctica.AAC.1